MAFECGVHTIQLMCVMRCYRLKVDSSHIVCIEKGYFFTSSSFSVSTYLLIRHQVVNLLLARTGSTLDDHRGSVLDGWVGDDDRLDNLCGIDSDGCGLFGSNSLSLGLLDLFH